MKQRQAMVGSLTDAEWDRLVTRRRGRLTDFLKWAGERERAPGQSMRLVNRDDVTRVRQVIPLFGEPWWAVVVYSCFDSLIGTRAVADAFKKPIGAGRADAVLSKTVLPGGAVQHHRTQPGHTHAKVALVSACEHATEIRYVLHEMSGFHERFEALMSMPLRWWGRTTCYDLLVRTGTLGIGGRRYKPTLAYLADSSGPGQGFQMVWGIEVNKKNANRCEDLLHEWTLRWPETCSDLGVAWEGRPYSSGDFENALCIYQDRRPRKM